MERKYLSFVKFSYKRVLFKVEIHFGYVFIDHDSEGGNI